MRKYIAKLLRHAAERLDPPPPYRKTPIVMYDTTSTYSSTVPVLIFDHITKRAGGDR